MRAKISTSLNTLQTSGCDGSVFITAHLENCSTPCGTQVETGTKQLPNKFVFFAEKQIGGGITFIELAFAPQNSFALVRVRGVSAGYPTVVYHTEYDPLNGSGWHDANTFTVSWGTGWPMGETERKGAITTMNSHHSVLKYQSSSDGPEVNWSGMTCVQDQAAAWKWRPVSGSSNAYDVVPGSTSSCIS